LSHSYFIPLISLWLVWTSRRNVAASVGDPSWSGVGIFGFSGLLLVLGKLLDLYLFQQIGLVFAIAGLVAALGGASLLRATWVPIAFLFFAVPPPYWFITVLSWKFQTISSVLGVAMIRLMNIPVFLSGNIIDLGDYKLQVAEACSGLRYLFPFLSLGVMTAYVFRGRLWQKLVIVAATVPITIVMNSFRIAVTGALVQAFGPEQAEGALHLFEGWVVFLFCLAALFGVVALFCRFSTPRQRAFDALAAPELAVVPSSRSALGFPLAASLIAGGAALFFGLSIATAHDKLIAPARLPFAELPHELPGWQAIVHPLDPSVAETLNADDSLVVDLVSPEGEYVNLYLAYLYERGDGRAWHSPRQCIPGGGWQITDHQIRAMTMADGKTVNYNRLVIENHGQKELVYYWYDQRGRDVANEFMMKIWVIYDSLARRRGDGALVRLIAPVAGDDMQTADKTLTDMMRRIHPFLPKYIPE
ncbi:MAG TPA: VPLPA-CTERM-specific exosortase XrtD, partial [Parvularculaceae bacterium]|nr:VPLPA-CTERM-specific exosortase XrtD [Parvularculaceae bacterium]